MGVTLGAAGGHGDRHALGLLIHHLAFLLGTALQVLAGGFLGQHGWGAATKKESGVSSQVGILELSCCAELGQLAHNSPIGKVGKLRLEAPREMAAQV